MESDHSCDSEVQETEELDVEVLRCSSKEDISVELTDTIVQMKECEIENECYPMKINSINMAISELEKQLNNLKETKEWTEQKLEDYNKHIEELSERKRSLDAELNRRIERGKTFQEDIVELTDRI